MDDTSRLLKTWLLQREQEGANFVKREVSEARKRLEGDRERWVEDVASSVRYAAALDASFLRTSLARRNDQAAASHEATLTCTATTSVAALSCDVATPEVRRANDNGIGDGVLRAQKKTAAGGWAASSWVEMEIRTRTDHDGAQSTVRDQPMAEEDAAEMEAIAARKRFERLESLATLTRKGLVAHWSKFFRDEMERRRLAAAALDMTADRWVKRQRELIGRLRASWHGREWKSAAATGTGDAPPALAGDIGDAVTAKDLVTEGKAKGEGSQPYVGLETAAKSKPEEAVADTEQLSEEGGDALAACAVDVKDSGGFINRGPPSDEEASEEEAAAGELVAFVGKGMAFHVSTIRSSHVQNFHKEHRRRRCSSFSAPPNRGLQEKRYAVK